MEIEKVYPGNGDLARITIRLTADEIEKIKNGGRLELEAWIGATSDEELPIRLEVAKQD